MQRPANLAGKRTFTDAELAARDEGSGEQRAAVQSERRAVRQGHGRRPRRSARTTDSGRRRTSSMTTGPRSSRIRRTDESRALTPEAIAIQQAHIRLHPPTDADGADVIEIRHWEDYDLAERCIAAQVPTIDDGLQQRAVSHAVARVGDARARAVEHANHPAGRAAASRRHHGRLDGRFARPLGGQHAGRRDEELHEQAEWRIGRGVRRPRGSRSATFM